MANLINAKEEFSKSEDQKIYLTSIKSFIGNVVDDNELIKISSLNKAKYSEYVKNVFITKKNKRIELIGEEQNNDLEKKIFLQIIDFSWRSHLQYLEQLRQVIGLRSYGQKDPLSEFKKESFNLFEGLLKKINIEVIKFLFNLNVVVSSNKEKDDAPKEIVRERKIGRNDKCPCGSGKKYKHCCGSV